MEKANSGRSRSSSRGSSPGRSPIRYDSSRNALVDAAHIQGFKVNLKPEKKSKLSSVVLKIRGIDQVTYMNYKQCACPFSQSASFFGNVWFIYYLCILSGRGMKYFFSSLCW